MKWEVIGLIRKTATFLLLAAVLAAPFSACGRNTAGKSVDGGITIAVSIVPQGAFVRAVAGDDIDVVTLVPPGYSPESYDPPPSLMQKLSDASIYFTIGVPAENSIIPRIKDMNSSLKIVRLEDEVGLVYPHRYFEEEHDRTDSGDTNTGSGHANNESRDRAGQARDANTEHAGHSHGGRDPHIWLSPKRVSVIIDVITRELSFACENNAEEYESNARKFKEELSCLDEKIKNMFKNLENRKFIMYHPSLGYFADDYGLEMFTLEKDGKEPSVRDMQELVDMARSNEINAILYQAEKDSGLTEAFASEIGGKSWRVDPLSEDYINNLLSIAETLHGILANNGR
jgi:zinc transport system substrate-binding protein